MMNGNDWLRLWGAAYIILCGTIEAPAADESRWDGDTRSALRLVTGSSKQDNAVPNGVLRAGVEIRLGRGWHTYWRYPGDSGVPPQFDFGQSQNVKSVDVLWPAPQRMAEAGGVAIGYVGNVIFPLRVVAADAGKPVVLRLKLDYAVCEKLCVPVEGKAELALAKGPSSQDSALAAAEARVPRKLDLVQGDLRLGDLRLGDLRLGDLDRGGGLAVRAVRRDDGAARPRVIVDLAAPDGASVDLFAGARAGQGRARGHPPVFVRNRWRATRRK
jgi:hypothetical protein